MNDTIVAVSTTLGEGAISIIRLSGDNAINIVNSIFRGKDLTKVETHTINYGFIKDEEEIIDEVMVSVMMAPKTYTRENVVEINTHGGIASVRRVLELCILKGARLAESGEFTKRAFLNGRIDLIEAESVMDLIKSEGEAERKIAINNLRGNLSNRIRKFRDEILGLIANIEVNIDYPEYEDIYVLETKDLLEKLAYIEEELKKIIDLSRDGLMVKQGINVAIVGSPNVGKSSLLNSLLKVEKAIVTDIPGTTRDVVEGKISLDGVIVNLLDTAGIRDTEDLVEQIGIDKSKKILKDADLVLHLLDLNRELNEEDKELLKLTEDKKRIIVMTKDDLERKNHFKGDIYLNTQEGAKIELLKEEIRKIIEDSKLKIKDELFFTNERQITKAKEALSCFNDLKIGVESEFTPDLLVIDLKRIWDSLGSITNESYDEELLDRLFSDFCVGK